MSILIKGIEMPDKDHFVLVEIDNNGEVFAAYDGGRTKLVKYKVNPILKPHGRLVDADVLVEFIKNLFDITWDGGYAGGKKDTCIAILEKIENLPTIIEAE